MKVVNITRHTLNCKYPMVAELVHTIVQNKLKKDNMESLRVIVKKEILEFRSIRKKDEIDLGLYNYYDYAEGVFDGLVHGAKL